MARRAATPPPVETLTPLEARANMRGWPKEIAAARPPLLSDDAPTVSGPANIDALRRRYEAAGGGFPELATSESLTRKVGAAPAEKFARGEATPCRLLLPLGNVFFR